VGESNFEWRFLFGLAAGGNLLQQLEDYAGPTSADTKRRRRLAGKLSDIWKVNIIIGAIISGNEDLRNLAHGLFETCSSAQGSGKKDLKQDQ
jgi:hypothetical protein